MEYLGSKEKCVTFGKIKKKYFQFHCNFFLQTNLVNHRSKITQTMKISTQLAVKTQTYEFKDKNLQTKKDNYSNVPKPSNFIYGLRGRKDDQQFTIQLTRPVQE